MMLACCLQSESTSWSHYRATLPALPARIHQSSMMWLMAISDLLRMQGR